MNDESPKLTGEKKNLYLEYILFLVLGFLLGIVIKTEAAKSITVGYNDYQVDTKSVYYDLNALQKKLKEESARDTEGREDQEVDQPENVSGASTSR